MVCALLVVALAPVAGVAAAPAGDGAWAKVGPELRALYDAFREAHASGRPLVLPDPAIPVVADRVIVDAVASGDVADLKAGLVALGMQGAVTAGRIVSGQLPISAIPAMAALPGLTFARAAVTAPHRGAGKGVR
jgi:hypothetical protein